MDPPEEPPALLWGRDPTFSAFVRLYVTDLLHMEESQQVPGIYFYNHHPVYKVDVLGLVVYRRERDDFYCYGVDDGTGVINCLCWKTNRLTSETQPAPPPPAGGGFSLSEERERLRAIEEERRRLEIGDLLRVRGAIKTSRSAEREITASLYYKVEDPGLSVQIAWMMDAPRLYRHFYHRPPALSTGANPVVSVQIRAVSVLKDFLEDNSVSRFRVHDVQELLEPLLDGPLTDLVPLEDGPLTDLVPLEDGPPTDRCPLVDGPLTDRCPLVDGPPGDSQGPSAGERLRQLVRETLKSLEDEGLIYCRVRCPEGLYLVTVRDEDLLSAVKDVIKEDSRRDKFSEQGVHVLHVLSSVRQRFSPNVTRSVLEKILGVLEGTSDIISTTDHHYTAF